MYFCTHLFESGRQLTNSFEHDLYLLCVIVEDVLSCELMKPLILSSVRDSAAISG